MKSRREGKRMDQSMNNEPTDAQVEKAFRDHIAKLGKLAEGGDKDAIRSLACMALLVEGWRCSPDDPDDGEKIIDFSQCRLAA
jgi:hypothetical protein